MTAPTSRTLTAQQLTDAGADPAVVTAFTDAFGSSADISPDFVAAHVDALDWATLAPVLSTAGKALYQRSIQVADAAIRWGFCEHGFSWEFCWLGKPGWRYQPERPLL